jgi:hypothetical protein
VPAIWLVGALHAWWRAGARAKKPAKGARSSAAVFSFTEVVQMPSAAAMFSAPAPTVLARDVPIDPALLEERRIQIRAQRHLKREQRTLEDKKQTLESELATVKENLDSVNNRKRLTRSQKLASFEPDQNRVYSVPMSKEDVAERSLSEDTKRAFAESRRAVVEARAEAQGSSAAVTAPQTSGPPAELSATPARGTKRTRPGLDSVSASAAELCDALLTPLLTPVLGWLGVATPSAAPQPQLAAAGIPSAAGHRGGHAMRISAYKRFFYLHHTSPTSTQRRGPVTAAQLRHEWSCGGVNPQTLVFAANGTMRGWTPIAQLPPLHSFLRKPAVPGTVRRPLAQPHAEAAREGYGGLHNP